MCSDNKNSSSPKWPPKTTFSFSFDSIFRLFALDVAYAYYYGKYASSMANFLYFRNYIRFFNSTFDRKFDTANSIKKLVC